MNNPQLTRDGKLKHLLSIEGLPKTILNQILDTAESFAGVSEREVKKVPLLRGKTVCNIFFENSTRTRTTFEIAAKRLSADVVSLNVSTSSQSKGETILDTVDNLIAMHTDMFVVRHAQSGAAHFIAQHVPPHIHVINAGDGRHAHPTQGLLDVFTIRKHKPDVVLGHNPWEHYQKNPDHRNVGRALVEAYWMAANPNVHPEHLALGVTPHAANASPAASGTTST